MTDSNYRMCEVEGCAKKHKGRGLCVMHLWRLRKTGSINLTPRPSAIERFNTKYAVSKTGCWLWTGAVSRAGYGQLSVNGSTIYAHRFSWEQANGPIPDGRYIDHVCFTPRCVNPAHLRLATPTENGRHISVFSSATGVRNVYFIGARPGETRRLGYRVGITVGGKSCSFGEYSTLSEAKAVAERERKKLFGDFAGKG